LVRSSTPKGATGASSRTRRCCRRLIACTRSERTGPAGCAVDTEAVGHIASGLGAGRRNKDDEIDPSVGLELLTKIGDHPDDGDLLARVFARSSEAAKEAETRVREALSWTKEATEALPLVYEVLWPERGTDARLHRSPSDIDFTRREAALGAGDNLTL
jgi:hypothetical protein